MTEYKLIIGQPAVLDWTPSAPGYTSTITPPSLVVAHPAGAITVPMTPVRVLGVVSAISADRRQVTLSGVPALLSSGVGITGRYGAVWLQLGARHQGSARVLRIVSDTVLELADPVPSTIPTTPTVGESWEVHWLAHTASLTALQVGAAVARSIAWTITASYNVGPALAARRAVERGVLHLVRAPFASGATADGFRARYPVIARMLAPADDLEDVLDRALAELIDLLRSGLDGEYIIDALPSGTHEDMLTGGQFRDAHELLTASTVYEAQAAQGRDGAEALADATRTRAYTRLRAARGRLAWVDLNDDGIVDTGETGISTPSPSLAIVSDRTSATYYTTETITPRAVERRTTDDER